MAEVDKNERVWLVTCLSSGEVVHVKEKVLRMSQVFVNYLEDLGDDDDLTWVLPAPHDVESFKRIVAFCEARVGETIPSDSAEDAEKLQEWAMADLSTKDREFFDALPGQDDKVNREPFIKALHGFIMLANFLDNRLALKTATKYEGHTIRTMTPEEIRMFFLGSESKPFTPEEEEAVKRAYPWCDPNPPAAA